MSQHSRIGWTDTSWNVITGCSRVSTGCKMCYAEQLTGSRLSQNPKYAGLTRLSGGEVKWTGEIRLHESELLKPLSWKKPRMIFVNSMSDTFHEKVPLEFIDKIFAVMALCPQHTFQVLTKRPERMAEYLNADGVQHRVARAMDDIEVRREIAALRGDQWVTNAGILWPLPGVWLGTSIESPSEVERADHLRRCPAAVRFLSLEPLLGDIMPTQEAAIRLLWGPDEQRPIVGQSPIHWVIVGGESGPNHREMDIDWLTNIVDQCKAAGVACWVKQDSGAKPGKRGRIPDEYWRVKEFPATPG